ncbi:MAG TPA: ATP-binding protein, partial [Verrucomicrobiae bacterium]|nr:ATP-binding protein [Verrucomicrobiae bacterium]
NRRIIVQSRWVLTGSHPGPRAILMIGTDVTEKKQLEAQILRNQRMESIGALASGIAHDLNNVLAPVLMGADLLGDHLANEGDRRILDMIRSSARRGTDLVRQILSFASGATGERQSIEIKQVMGETRRLIESTFPQSIKVETAIMPGIPGISGNPTQLHQVLLNLCVNARDAMPRGGVLRLTATIAPRETPEAREYVVIAVSDTGSGIPAGKLEEIFQPFFTTKDPGQGTGLGLSTAKGIVEHHGGFMTVQSTVGVGSTFQVYLPSRTKSHAPAAPPPTVVLPSGKGELVLIVDDETAVLEILKTVLETFHYRVLTAADGAKALQVFQENAKAIDVVVSDLSMPVLDGMALIRTLRHENPSLRIIGSSGLLSSEQQAQLEALSLTVFLPKPYPPETLLRALRDALEPGRAKL